MGTSCLGVCRSVWFVEILCLLLTLLRLPHAHKCNCRCKQVELEKVVQHMEPLHSLAARVIVWYAVCFYDTHTHTGSISLHRRVCCLLKVFAALSLHVMRCVATCNLPQLAKCDMAMQSMRANIDVHTHTHHIYIYLREKQAHVYVCVLRGSYCLWSPYGCVRFSGVDSTLMASLLLHTYASVCMCAAI